MLSNQDFSYSPAAQRACAGVVEPPRDAILMVDMRARPRKRITRWKWIISCQKFT